MEYLTTKDLESLCGESQGKINLAIAGMTMLMNETNEKVELLEGQTWFQRMSNTITGKNKMTVEEISKNRDKINVYMSEALSALYDRNRVDHEIILGMGTWLTELQANQLELKMMLKGFVQKLNEKIISIDNFHMLMEEINLGIYNADEKIISICKVLSQLDVRTLQDERKMSILMKTLKKKGIITNKQERIVDVIVDLLKATEEDAGILLILFELTKEEYVSTIIKDIMFHFFCLPEEVRYRVNKEALVEALLQNVGYNIEITVSTEALYSMLENIYANHVYNAIIEKKKEQCKRGYDGLKSWLNKTQKYLDFLCSISKTWSVERGELNTAAGRKYYYAFINEVIDNLSEDSRLGTNIVNNLRNITGFIRNVLIKYPDLHLVKDNKFEFDNNAALEFPVFGEYTERTEKYTLEDIFYKANKTYFGNRKQYSWENFSSIDDEMDIPELNVVNVPSLWGVCYLPFYYNYIALSEAITTTIGENIEKYEEIYEMVDDFPVEYEIKEYEKVFIKSYDDSKPYISFLTEDTDEKVIGNVSVIKYENWRTTKVKIYVSNISKYTISFSIIKNQCDNLCTRSGGGFFSGGVTITEYYEYCSVAWGEWQADGSIELLIRKLYDDTGSLIVKIFIKDTPDVVAYLKIEG